MKVRRRQVWALRVAAALVASLTGCTSTPLPGGLGPSTPDSSSAPDGVQDGVSATVTATPKAAKSPLPVPTGPPITAALAAAPHFVLYFGGASDLSVTGIEGQDIESPQPRAVMKGAPLTPGEAVFAPALSPDRKRVAYVEGRPDRLTIDGQGAIVVQNVDGSAGKVVAPGSDTGANNGSPTWSPDGTKIAFLRGRALWMMNTDGSDQHDLMLALSVNTHIAWSPDGKKLAVGSGNPSRIAVVDLASRSFNYVGPDNAQADHPAWSPDGKQLVYGMAGPNALFMANADGSGARQITTCVHPACSRDLEPAWSPDGAYIAFMRYAPGTHPGEAQQVYILPAYGGEARQITAGPEGHAFPTW